MKEFWGAKKRVSLWKMTEGRWAEIQGPQEEAGARQEGFLGVHKQLDHHRKRPGLGAGSFGVSRKSFWLGQREIWDVQEEVGPSGKRLGPAGREICCEQEAAGAWPGMIEPWESQI